MNEKIFELFDLLFSLILLGSLIRQIPIVNKVLTGIENFFDFISKYLPNKTDHEWILFISKVMRAIAIFLFVLTFILLKIENTLRDHLYIANSFFFFSYLWIALNTAKPTKEKIFKSMKSNIWLLICPFIFLACDLFLGTNILKFFSQDFFNLILNLFNYQIPNSLWDNFLAFASILYIGIIFQLIFMWGVSQPPYFIFLLFLKIMRHPQKQERILFFVLLAFFANKLALIFLF